MPRLTKAELMDHRAWLSEWRAPAEMADRIATVNDAMGSCDFFRQAGVEFLRDARLAAEFGRHRRSEAVRLVPGRELWPDFEARAGGVIERVECAEADVPGRRRGDEYRRVAEQTAGDQLAIKHDPIENWVVRADQVPAALAATIATKIRKHYGSPASMLVYLNIGEFGIREVEIAAAMAPAVAPALAQFQRVWIL